MVLGIVCIGSINRVTSCIRTEEGVTVNSDGSPTLVCWNCVKGRHALCPAEMPADEDGGGAFCECPVCHANRYVRRQPVFDPRTGSYYDPGPYAEPER